MRILVAGRSGQLAAALAECAARAENVELQCLGRPQLDLDYSATLRMAIADFKPALVVNAAAYTAVDRAELEPNRAFAINQDGAEALARAAAEAGSAFIHLSTDYVFDGLKSEPYMELDATNPLNAYGRSKRAGEQAVLAAHPRALVLRSSWVFSPFGANFVKTMLNLGAERGVLRVVDDQQGNPTSALDLAAIILAIAPAVREGAGGLYNIANSGSTSWHGFASFIFAEAEKHGRAAPKLEAISSAAYPTLARRPPNSRLDCKAFIARFGITPRPWQDAAAETIARLLA